MPKLAVALAAFAMTAALNAGAAELVTDGSFSNLTNGPGSLFFGSTSLTDWTSTGYNNVFAPGTLDTATNQLELWGTNNGGPDTITAPPTTNPTTTGATENIVSLDGAYAVGPLYQTVSGLVAGDKYVLTFAFAGGQQYTFNGDTTEQIVAGLGSVPVSPSTTGGGSNLETFATQVLSDPSHGFTGWYTEQFTFTANASSEILSFLAVGTPEGVPPMSLLAGPSIQAAVPEPAAWTMLLIGLAAAGGAIRRRRTLAVI